MYSGINLARANAVTSTIAQLWHARNKVDQKYKHGCHRNHTTKRAHKHIAEETRSKSRNVPHKNCNAKHGLAAKPADEPSSWHLHNTKLQVTRSDPRVGTDVRL